MTTKSTNIHIPKLRFPEFQNEREWEVKRLGEIVKDVDDKCSINELQIETYISTENMLQNLEGVKKASKLPETGSFTCFKKGDILFSNIRPYLKKVWQAEFDGAASNDVIVFRALNGFDYHFVSQIIKSDSFIAHTMAGAKGVKMPRGDKNMMMDYIVCIPSLAEQQRTAACLSALDEMLSATKDKLEQLKAYKKGLMQKLFPAHGKTLPEYRFKEFEKDGEWKVKKLGELIVVNSGKDYKHLNHGNIPVFGTGGYMLSVDDKLSDVDAVGIGRKGTIDKPQYLKAPFWTVDTLFFLTEIGGNDIRFIYYLSQTIPWKKYGEQTGVPSLSKVSIENLEVIVPSSTVEQNKIVQTLLSLDEEIDSLSKKRESIENYKNGLIQQLFTK